jgi:Protein of unknown function (DUF732)
MPTLRHFTAFVGAAAVASTLGLAALASAGVASASSADDTFVSVLRDEGIVAPSAREAISTGHAVCAVFDEGLSLLDAVSAVSDTTGLEMEDAAFFVGASVATYCPEHEELIGA